MLETTTMYVRCTHCGYDNSPEYRFCGMCGASLAHPPVATKPPAKDIAPEVKQPSEGGNGKPVASETVHGPSFLGLSEDPKVEFHYLYEDEEPSSHIGLIFVLILLIGAGGFGYWQWRHNGFPFNRFGGNNAATQSASSQTPSNQTASPSEVAPAPSQDQQTHIDKPMTGAGEVLPSEGGSNNQPQNGSAAAPAGQNPQPPSSGTSAQNSAPANAAGDNANPSQKAPEAAKPTEEANATPPPVAPEKAPAKKHRTPAPKAAPKRAEQPEAASATKAAPDADLEASGERYLYGTGGPQNCTRAESNLRTAAMHGNAKAQAVLGTMYYTGHCVGRDLPTAYRWFARALRKDPQNSTLSADLQVLWRQMSADERQLAIKNEQ
jgi:zinc ribbon protein/Sel1 repeat-containing protein